MSVDRMRKAALIGGVISLLSLATARAGAGGNAKPQYVDKTIEGFTVRVDSRLLGERKAIGSKALRLLKSHLYHIDRVVPPRAVAELRKVRLWLHYDRRKGKGAQYHPSRGWLVNNGYDPALARCVDLGNADNFIRSCGHQPWLALHELAHAYHHQVWGFDHPEVVAAHKRAVESKAYDKVLVWNGRRSRAYAISNHKEYFAETTEAFFGTNDVYPFVRAELRAHDPEMFKLLEKLWAGPPAAATDPGQGGKR